MILNTDGTKPIYIQISEWLETEILNKNLGKGEKVYSQYKLAEMFNINPATAAKGLTKLAEDNILYDKRGIGKFVSNEARSIIVDRRKNQTLKRLMEDIVQEAERLDITEDELIEMLRVVTNESKGEEK